MNIRPIASCLLAAALLAPLAIGCAVHRDARPPVAAAGPTPLYTRGATDRQIGRDPLLRESRVVGELTKLCDARMSEAEVAQASARRASVRDFATHVLEDNRRLCARLDALWRELGLVEIKSPQGELAAQGYRAAAVALTGRKGSFVDQAFLQTVVDEHRTTIVALETLLSEARHPELRSFIRSEFMPVASKSLLQAKEMLSSSEELGETH